MSYPKSFHSALNEADCLYSQTEIESALDRMALEITNTLQDKNPVIICIMTGALITTGHLLTRLRFSLEVDYIHATRYRGAIRGGDLHWLVEPRKDLADRTVLLVDDIMDGGITLAAIMDYCQQAKAKEVYSAVLVSKSRTREPGVHFEPDFYGVKAEDRFLFGFGLDYDDQLRNAPGIYAFKNNSA